jgi:hypothetical protein
MRLALVDRHRRLLVRLDNAECPGCFLAGARPYRLPDIGLLTHQCCQRHGYPSNQQSADLTASVLRHPGGQVVVVAVGVAFVVCGAYMACSSWRRDFRKELNLAGASPRTRRIVMRLGQIGGIARGVVFAAVGVFLLVAGAKAQPGQARGIDATLRAFAQTPLGPWLLVVVAIGLVTFGLYSCCEARWRKVS